MYPTDRREAWPADILTDSRVVNYWDERKRLEPSTRSDTAKWRAPSCPINGLARTPILWDAYLVYGPDARWEDAPTGLRRWGRTILKTQDGLRSPWTTCCVNQRTGVRSRFALMSFNTVTPRAPAYKNNILLIIKEPPMGSRFLPLAITVTMLAAGTACSKATDPEREGGPPKLARRLPPRPRSIPSLAGPLISSAPTTSKI